MIVTLRRVLLCLSLVACGFAATEARAQVAPPPEDGTTAPAAPAPQPGYPPNPPPGYGPPSGYPPPPPYPPPPAYPPPPPHYYRGSYGTPPPPPGSHTHDGGYFRLQFGLGYNNMSASAGGDTLKVTGGGGGLGIAFGGAVTPNLIIYGTILDSVATDPTISQSGVSGNFSGTANGASAGVVGLGAGVAYYLDPAVNVFLSATLMAARLVVNDKNGNTIGRSNFGLTAEGQVGKEWWVSDNWGLGASLQGVFGKMDDSEAVAGGPVPTWTVFAFNVLLSATYN